MTLNLVAAALEFGGEGLEDVRKSTRAGQGSHSEAAIRIRMGARMEGRSWGWEGKCGLMIDDLRLMIAGDRLASARMMNWGRGTDLRRISFLAGAVAKIALVKEAGLVRVCPSLTHTPPYEAARMNLGDLLTVEQILPEMKSTERWSAIVELVELLVSQARIRAEDKEMVLSALRAREETMSTGIGFGDRDSACFLGPGEECGGGVRAVLRTGLSLSRWIMRRCALSCYSWCRRISSRRICGRWRRLQSSSMTGPCGNRWGRRNTAEEILQIFKKP